MRLYEDSKNHVIELTRSQHAVPALDFVFSQPVFNSAKFKDGSKIPDSTGRRILKLFAENGLLKVVREQSGRRPAVYAFAELLNITEGRKLF